MRWSARSGLARFTLLVAFVGCDQEGVSRSASALSVALDSTRGAESTFVVVHGLSSVELRDLRDRSAATRNRGLRDLLQVAVDDSATQQTGVLVSGRHAISDSTVEFHPQFPLDRGRTYRVAVNAQMLKRTPAESLFIARVALPAGDRTPRTMVRAVFPANDTVPENLLRLYIEFSAPMSRTGGLDYITLRDERGIEVKAAFLPLDADFWNDDRTRYTAFLDPGRVKRGILPNEQMGRAILAGHRYSVVIDSTWRDANGLPLVATYRHTFQVKAPDETIIDLKAWRITPPLNGSRDAVRVLFNKPLDHGLLARALGVERKDGSQVTGTVEIAPDGREWRFTPDDSWRAGGYQLLVLSILEDPAGNRIDGPFEVDMFERVDKSPAPERHTIPFTIGAK
jgi:hypothetical protein